ncbi:MAG: hypothetical protein JW797_03175 [Bradymonadales bacterium]|nr:hypothetical protein [Bradymonadales bacterium]
MSVRSEDADRHEKGYGVLQLEKLMVGELPEEELQELQAHLGAHRLDQHRDALESHNAELLQRFPSEKMIVEIRRRAALLQQQEQARIRRQKISRIAAWSGAMAAATAVLLAVLLLDLRIRPGVAPVPPSLEETTIKGLEPTLNVYRRMESGQAGADGAERLEDGAVVEAGNVIRLGYVAAGRPYGVIVSIDGAGAVSLHLPPRLEGSTRLEESGEVLLDRAFRLDDAPLFERFFFVTSPSLLPTEQVIQSARRLAADPAIAAEGFLDLPEPFEQIAFTLRKERP